MNFAAKQYQFSQKYQIGTTLMFIIVGIIVGIIIGIAYSVISSYSPFIIIDIGLILGLVFVLIKINTFFCKKAKSRNAKVNMLLAFITALSAYYSSIVTFEIILLGLTPYEWLELFFSPHYVIDIMVNSIIPYREITITKSASKIEISGIVLILLYVVEFVLFIVPSVVSARKMEDYYCEDCQSWYKEFKFFSFSDDKLISNIGNTSVGNYADALSGVKFYKHILEIIQQIDPKSDEEVGVLQFQYCQCPNCHKNSILSIIPMKQKKEKKKIFFVDDSSLILVKDTYIDNRTDQFFSSLKESLYYNKLND